MILSTHMMASVHVVQYTFIIVSSSILQQHHSGCKCLICVR